MGPSESIALDLTDSEAPLPFPSVLDRKLAAGEQVYTALQRAIVAATLLPGMSISENRICRHFGISRTPVRAALLRLAKEGLIEIFPQKGSFVAPIKLAEIADSHFVRRSLEVAITEELAALWTPKFSRTASAIIASQRAAIAAGDDETFYREDERFHHALATFAGREGVWDSIAVAQARLTRFVRLFGKPERLPQVVVEHTAVVAALDRGDGDAAADLLREHLDKIFILIEQLPDVCRPYIVE